MLFFRPSAWGLTPKILTVFLLAAILPVLAASLFSLNYYYGVSFEGAKANLARELRVARQFLLDGERRLESDLRLASRENLVVLNLSLGLTAPVLDYLEGLRRERQLAVLELLDSRGESVGRAPTEGPDLATVLTADQLSRARESGSLSLPVSLSDGRVLLLALVPVSADLGDSSYYLLAGLDPGNGEPGGLLDTVGLGVSGPVILAGPRRVLGASPGSPLWDASVRWPEAFPDPGTLFSAHSGATTYLFGFTPVGSEVDPSAWIGVSFSLDQYREITDAAARGLVLIAGLSILISCLAGVAFSRGLTRPLLRMAGQARAWTEGQGGLRLEVTTQDESGTLGRAFNEVLDRLDGTLYALRKTQNYLKNIFNSLTSVLISVDENGTVQEWNVAAERFNGTKAAEALGRAVWDLSPVFRGLEPLLDRAVATREPQFIKKDQGRGQEKRHYDICFYPLVWNGVSGAVIRMDDITDSLKKDKQLRQSQKMETVGTLTGGIAHNFNNLLTGIIGTVSLVELELSGGGLVEADSVRLRIAMIEDSAKKAAEIVRRLMSLSRGGAGEFGSLDLASVVRDAVATGGMVLDPSVEVEALDLPDQALVYGDRSQLDQCLLNLMINAAHAMTIMRPRDEHQGGTIRISLQGISAVNDFLASHPEAVKSDYWILRVQDGGVGISPANLGKVFDPFFTTKEQHVGSGLGLAMVYASVHQHNGFIDVYSELGRGTTVSLYLPVLGRTVFDTPVLRTPGAPGLHRGQGLILVVDDEAVVLVTAQRILEACGYSVLTATNGEEALAIYSAHREIRAVLLDYSMPRLSGTETLVALRNLDPKVKVVMSSGLYDATPPQGNLGASPDRLLPKPYSLDELSRVLWDLLEANP